MPSPGPAVRSAGPKGKPPGELAGEEEEAGGLQKGVYWVVTPHDECNSAAQPSQSPLSGEQCMDNSKLTLS